jgi:hypothetical protein
MTDTLLILGCGAVGAACAAAFHARAPGAQLILHSRSQARIDELMRLRELDGLRDRARFVTGDLWHDTSVLDAILEQHRPRVVVDCMPIANLLATAHQRRMRGEAAIPEPFELLNGYIVACLRAFRRHGLEKLYKVSTAGLGGMGYACPYGHGVNDALDTLDKLKLKVFYAGALHQALVNLDDTPGCQVAVMAPKSLIGWQDEYLTPPFESDGVCIGLGDGTRYTVQELALCSAPSQFGLISKDEIANLVADSVLLDSERGDIIRGVARASVVPAATAQVARQQLMRRMRGLQLEHAQRRLTNGALGPRATEDLLATLLVILRRGSDGDPIGLMVEHGYVRADEIAAYPYDGARLGTRDLDALERDVVAAAHASGLALIPEHTGELLLHVYERFNWKRKMT